MKPGYTRMVLVVSKKVYAYLQVYALREGKTKSEIVDRILEEELEKRLNDTEKQLAERFLSTAKGRAGSAGSPEGGS